MERRMLQGFQERAEGHISPWVASDAELAFWLVSFIGFFVLVIVTAVGQRTGLAFLLALSAAIVTLALIFA
jgi:hypothetical protein